MKTSHFLLQLFFCSALLITQQANAQHSKGNFTHADTLRGTYGSTRDWWDVTHYDLSVNFDIANQSISGKNIISFKIIKPGKIIQVDLQEPMILDSITLSSCEKGKITNKTAGINKPAITKDGNAYLVNMPPGLPKNAEHQLIVYYHGKPRVAVNPPWDGGMVWAKDKTGSPWVTVTCQGLGASVWYPCKDHQADEPDSAAMHVTIPDSLISVGNGRLREKTINADNTATYTWAVQAPINNYCFVTYIGKYVHFGETYKGLKGNLSMDYWVLPQNEDKAKIQFKEAPKMMKAFEHWFGPYPFYADGYKLVQSPYLGMENQTAIAYGNGFQNGYLGRDLSGTGWGLKFDFIIVHESGHEWFANNITTKDIADMWVHEGFTNYSEVLFTDYYFGTKAGNEYAQGIRQNIQNDIPVTGVHNVNNSGSGDMYYKAANMIHIIRQVMNDDEKFRKMLIGMNKTFYHQTVTAAEVEKFINQFSGKDFSKLFSQYLTTTQVPVLEYKIDGYNIAYRYSNCIAGYNVPVKIHFKIDQWIYPTTIWKTKSFYPEGEIKFSVDKNFYINTKEVK